MSKIEPIFEVDDCKRVQKNVSINEQNKLEET